MSINNKITLKVKSGPGDIIGNTELEMENNIVYFDKIQFNMPGEYTISVIPSNKNSFEETEFTINVLPEEEFIPQEEVETPEEVKEDNSSRPIISQINQPTIDLKPIEFETEIGDRAISEIGSTLGFTPFIWINEVEISPNDIIRYFLYYEDLIPKCRFTFYDTFNLIKNPETSPTVNTKFQLFLNSGSDVLKSIHLRFKIESVSFNKNKSITILGTLDLDDFYNMDYKSYKGTSFEVLKKMSSEFGLGYNSNINNTNDNMPWIKYGKNYSDFIKSIINHSYISDDSFMLGYIDFYWCLNYVDLEKEWKRDIENDYAINSQGISSFSDKSDNISRLILTNDQSQITSVFYFTNVKINNNSTYQNLYKGIFTKSKVYDKINKSFLKFDIDSLTSDVNDKIVLKGDKIDTKELKNNYKNKYGGKIDIDNMHPNYKYAPEQNKRNLINLFNISIDITLPNPNFNLYLYQKVKIIFVNKLLTISNSEQVDERLSGDWMIVDIAYSYSGGTLLQRVKAARKELSKTKNEMKGEVTAPINNSNNIDNSQLNENPIDALPPNERYSEPQPQTEPVNKNYLESNNTNNTILNNSSDTPEVSYYFTPNNLKINRYFLPSSEYFSKSEPKYIFLHHTAGWNNPYKVIDSWSKDNRGKIATEFVIGGQSISGDDFKYDGEILQSFPEGNWAFHLGIGRNKVHRDSVGIELNNFGYLTKGGYVKKVNGFKRWIVMNSQKYYTYSGSEVHPSQVIKLNTPFRGYEYWHKYSDTQIETLKKLILYISERNNIDPKEGLPTLIKTKGLAAFDYIKDLKRGKIKGGIWSHTNVRLDKFDIFPQPNLVDMLITL